MGRAVRDGVQPRVGQKACDIRVVLALQTNRRLRGYTRLLWEDT